MLFSNKFRKKVAFLLVFSGIAIGLNCTSNSKVGALSTSQIIAKQRENILNSMRGKLDVTELEALHDRSKADYPENDNDYFLNLFSTILHEFPTDLKNWEAGRFRLLKTIVSSRELCERHLDMVRLIAKIYEAKTGASKRELIQTKEMLSSIQSELRESSSPDTFAVRPFGKSKGRDRIVKQMIKEGLDDLYEPLLTSFDLSCDFFDSES